MPNSPPFVPVAVRAAGLRTTLVQGSLVPLCWLASIANVALPATGAGDAKKRTRREIRIPELAAIQVIEQ